MSTQNLPARDERASVAPSSARSLLRRRVASLSDAECGEVIEYIEVMQSLSREAADLHLFSDGFARRISAMCDGEKRAHVFSSAGLSDASA